MSNLSLRLVLIYRPINLGYELKIEEIKWIWIQSKEKNKWVEKLTNLKRKEKRENKFTQWKGWKRNETNFDKDS